MALALGFNSRSNAVRPLVTGTQAERIYAKFGGVPQLFHSMQRAGVKRSLPSIYRWNYPRSHGGSDGIIPTAAWSAIMKAARFEGIIIGPEDLFPG